MSPDITEFLMKALIIASRIIVAITLHEASHGFVAWKLGDDTAYRLGRVTFNPLRHIDPMGTIITAGIILFVHQLQLHVRLRKARAGQLPPAAQSAPRHGAGGGCRAGIESGASRSRRRLLLHVAPSGAASLTTAVVAADAHYSIFFNVILGVFNMIPLPPLDGGRVAVGLLPYPLAVRLARLERYGMIILLDCAHSACRGSASRSG